MAETVDDGWRRFFPLPREFHVSRPLEETDIFNEAGNESTRRRSVAKSRGIDGARY